MGNVFKQLIDDVIIKESSKYTNDPSDRGGETKYGITAATARANGYTGSMKELTYDFAYQTYLKDYIYKLGIDKILKLLNNIHTIKLCEELLDTAVNMGVGTSSKFLQRSLNILNNQEKFYTDIVVDGSIGNGTMISLTKYISSRKDEGVLVLIGVLNALQANRYISICENDPTQEKYFYGWIKNRVLSTK
jgi:lysozyme family protein